MRWRNKSRGGCVEDQVRAGDRRKTSYANRFVSGTDSIPENSGKKQPCSKHVMKSQMREQFRE